MRHINLDLDTLRTLAVAHYRGGLAQAAEHLGRTPSAISLQMKRLQDDLGVAIFVKRGRRLGLTENGEVALAYARRILALNDELLDTTQRAGISGAIRLGAPQDFASVLPEVLAHFAALYPRMQIELLIEGNASLLEAVQSARIDLAAIIGRNGAGTGETIGHVEMGWIASSSFSPREKQPLPLAVLGPKCAFRRCAIERLEEADIEFRIAASSPSLDGLWAALRGGLGVTARAALDLPEGLAFDRILHGLPALGSLPVTVHRNAGAKGEAVDRMAALLTDALKPVLHRDRRGKAVRRVARRASGQGAQK
ncbi:MAG TPA: LysR substrate-binding domain-containing protein [Steroidobacteraceae bacterium]|jgi:DNA-binding transcriptional LysR family regulator